MRPAPPTRHVDLGHFTISPDTAVTQSLVAVSVAPLSLLIDTFPARSGLWGVPHRLHGARSTWNNPGRGL